MSHNLLCVDAINARLDSVAAADYLAAESGQTMLDQINVRTANDSLKF